MQPDFIVSQLDDEDCNSIQHFVRRFKIALKDKDGTEFHLTAKVHFQLHLSDHSTAFNPENVILEHEGCDRVIPTDPDVSEILQKQIRDAVIEKMKAAGMDENPRIPRQYT